jgi:hypothetical protein
MEIEELPAEALHELYTCVSAPAQVGRTREALRASNAGLHVEVRGRRAPEQAQAPLAMDEVPSRLTGRVITLSFGAR